MKKKEPFKNNIKAKNAEFSDLTEIHGPALDGRDRASLLFPDRVKDKTVKWDYQKTHAGYLGEVVGQEADKFDEKKQKFYNNPDRPLGRTFKTVKEK